MPWFAALQDQRREVEQLLASTQECSMKLAVKGTALIRTHERLLACAAALDAIVNADPDTDGYAELEEASLALGELTREAIA